MATATQYIAELNDAGIPTHRPAIQQLCARRAAEDAGYDLKAMIQALPAREQLDIAEFIADLTSAYSYGSDRIREGVEYVRDDLDSEDADNARRGNGVA